MHVGLQRPHLLPSESTAAQHDKWRCPISMLGKEQQQQIYACVVTVAPFLSYVPEIGFVSSSVSEIWCDRTHLHRGGVFYHRTPRAWGCLFYIFKSSFFGTAATRNTDNWRI
jgi:hypothetical protein